MRPLTYQLTEWADNTKDLWFVVEQLERGKAKDWIMKEQKGKVAIFTEPPIENIDAWRSDGKTLQSET